MHGIKLKPSKTFALTMYKYTNKTVQTALDFGEFSLPFGGKLNDSNRWVKLAHIIPWDTFEDTYLKQFSEGMGTNAIPFRVALGALIIKERLTTTDREAVEQIRENPYLQYFLGYSEFKYEAIIKASLANKKETSSKTHSEGNNDSSSNSGKLIIDATCTPADIRYPIDLSTLNEGREKTERIIDVLWESSEAKNNFTKKP